MFLTATMATFCAWKEKQPDENYADTSPKKPKKTTETPTVTTDTDAPPPSPPPSTDPPATDPPVPTTSTLDAEVTTPAESTHDDITAVEPTDSAPTDSAPTTTTDDAAAVQAELSALGIEDSSFSLPPADGIAAPESDLPGGNGDANIDMDALRDAGIDFDF